MRDAASGSGPRRLEVAAWVGGPAFRRVCETAGVKPENMHLAFRGLLLAPQCERRERAMRISLILLGSRQRGRDANGSVEVHD